MLEVFEMKLKDAIQKLPFDKILTLKNVRNIINEADGYQPHIIAPENGYRRLIEEGLSLLREPANHAVSQVCLFAPYPAVCADTSVAPDLISARSHLQATLPWLSGACWSPDAAADCLQVHVILKSIVTTALNSPECRDLARFANLKSEIVTNAAKTLGAPQSCFGC